MLSCRQQNGYIIVNFDDKDIFDILFLLFAFLIFNLVFNHFYHFILTILKNTKVSKAAGLANLSGRFLKNGAKVLAKPITELCNLSTTSGKFSESCKIAKLKPIYK